MILDKVDWQLEAEGDYLPDLSEEQAHVPVGLLVWWLVHRGHASAELLSAHDRVATDSESAGALYAAIGGVLTSGHIVEGVGPFVQTLLEDVYWTDLDELFPEVATVFSLPDTDATRRVVAGRLDRRLTAWQQASQVT